MTAEHEFGGPWTEVKLDAIADYLAFFTAALRNKPRPERPFELWYVDAFAGTGERTAQKQSGGLFDGAPIETVKVQLDGSARRALAVSPPFSRLIFVEQNAKRFAALQKLEAEFPGRGVSARTGDGNQVLQGIFEAPPWSHQLGGKGNHRAVVFLDPYDMSVRWDTLKLLSLTGSVDVWYLFPLNAVVRQLANDFSAVDESKQASLDEIFGTTKWREELYEERVQNTLFDTPQSATTRTASQRQIEAYARRRLLTLFPYVSQPLPLLTPRNAQLFSLFCASGNSSPVAQALVEKGVAHVLKKYG